MEGLGEPDGRPRGLATWLEGFRTQTMTTPGAVRDAGHGAPQPGATRPCRRRRRAPGDRVRGRVASRGSGAAGGGGASWPSPLDRRRSRARGSSGGHRRPAPRRARPGRCPTWSGRRWTRSPRELAAAGLPPPTVLEEIDTRASDGQVLSQTPAAGTAHPGAIALVVARAPVVTYLAGPLGGQRRPRPRNAQRRRALLPPLDLRRRPPRCHKRSTVRVQPGQALPAGAGHGRAGRLLGSIPAAGSCSRRSWTTAPSSPRPSGSTRPCRCKPERPERCCA